MRPWITVMFVALAIAAVAPFASGGQASSGTSVSTTGSAVSGAGSNGVTNVSVQLDAQDALTEFEIRIEYDPDVIEVEDADAITMNPRWDPPTGLPLLIDASEVGAVTVHATTGDACPVGSTCPLFSFAWLALADGSTELALASVTLTGTENGAPGTLSGVSLVSGTVNVGQAATATAVATATPSPTSTAVPTASPTPTGVAVVSPTVATTPAGATPTAQATQAVGEVTAVAPAQPPSTGAGLSGGGQTGLAQGAMLALMVAALLAFAWITTSLRSSQEPVAAMAAMRTEGEKQMDLITDYLRTMEALGMASSSIDLESSAPAEKPHSDDV